MRINAYILAADPAWIEESVLSYYDIVDEILVSHDRNSRGWTGAPIAAQDCLDRLRAIDRDKKMRFVAGDYSRPDFRPMENDTYQRQCALAEVGDADWVLQIDTDEVLPNPAALVGMLRQAEALDISTVEWPMRVLFHTLKNGQYLEVCAADFSDCFEYPGPIAVRPGVTFVDARRTSGPFLRPVVAGDLQSLQVRRSPEPNEHRVELHNNKDAILHRSWARSAASVHSKIASWGHNEGLRSWLFYYLRWKPAPYLWRVTRDFHPFARGLWPALKPCECCLPSSDAKALK